ncbi:MAG TPA: protease modulator HflC [Opitutales bacterium]|nr:protease modulator HflC [Opitutales bacterium]
MNRQSGLLFSFGLLVVLGGLLLYPSLYVVEETEQVILTQFGEIQGEPVTEAGLHWRLPFIQKVNVLEKRILSWDGESSELPTKDKLFVRIDSFARWKIKDPQTFFLRLRNERTALTRLDDILDSAAREAIANHVLLEIVRSENREVQLEEELEQLGSDVIGRLDQISVGRDRIERMIVSAAQPTLESLGIELLDLRIKRLNYNDNVQRQIFQRMISEREQIAARFRSEGEGEAARILGQRDRDLRDIQSEAYRVGQEIMGVADAEASAIYAQAYGGTAEAQEYYEFVKTLETLEQTMTDDSMIILSTDSDLFRPFSGLE